MRFFSSELYPLSWAAKIHSLLNKIFCRAQLNIIHSNVIIHVSFRRVILLMAWRISPLISESIYISLTCKEFPQSIL